MLDVVNAMIRQVVSHVCQEPIKRENAIHVSWWMMLGIVLFLLTMATVMRVLFSNQSVKRVG